MKNKRLAVFLGAVALLALSVPLFAHHGRSNYDMTSTATVKGVVTEFQWVNPHALILVDATGDNGKIEKWIAETNSPNTLSRQGWSRSTVKVGDQITWSDIVSRAAATTSISARSCLPMAKKPIRPS